MGQILTFPTLVESLGDVAVFGLGVSGIATVDYLSTLSPLRVKSITVYGGSSSNEKSVEAAKRFEESGIPVYFDTENVQGHFDLGIISPGIAVISDFYKSAKAACDELVSEPDFAFMESPQRWICITGTNGKTTTTTLVAHLLESVGIKAYAVGNIGEPVIAHVKDREEGSVFVAELSSFQLASSPHIKPSVAVLINITPDHVYWHGSFEEYVLAKKRLFDNCDVSTRAIICMGDDECEKIANELDCRYFHVVRIDEDMEDMLPIPFEQMKIKGTHNLKNALCAVAAVIPFVKDETELIDGLRSFEPLEHRIEPCGTINGVACFNDSKATNVDSTIQALSAFGMSPLILLLGGHDKGTDLTELARLVNDRCKTVVCFGEARERFIQAFEDYSIEVLEATGLEAALDAALDASVPGDVIVLSPACSSFDEFKSFEDRGTHFKEWVAARAASKE